ncbi:MAG: phospholipase, partial [Gammaproteobacteria bacterium]
MRTLQKALMGAAFLSGAMTAGTASADTYVFITNTTPQTVSVSVSHYGTRTLVNGSEWAQEATSIGPYETKR